jgi:hypothetical protein
LRFYIIAVLILSTLTLLSPESTLLASDSHRFLENGRPVNRGADAGFLLDTPTRSKIDLSGQWNYSVEHGPTGLVQVPCAFDFTGKVGFERTFEVTDDLLDKYELHFVMLGSNYNTEVHLNGDFLTNHIGGYTSFVQAIPRNALQPGKENVVRIVVSNELDNRKTIPLRSSVWGLRNYGGILRDVYILATPKLFISDVTVTTQLSDDLSSARVTVVPNVEGIELDVQEEPTQKKPVGWGLYFEMFDKISGFPIGRSPVVPVMKDGKDWQSARLELGVHTPKVWSPESPELYVVKCFLGQTVGKEFTVIDEYDVNVGIRKLELAKGNIHLNGKRITLKGVIWQDDHPTYGSSIPYDDLEKDIVLIKNLGANLVRFGSRPPHPYMLNLCDRYGLLAMVELPVVNVPASILGEEYYADLAGSMMREMISRDKNHASVLAWGLGDDCESSSPDARRFVQSLVGLAKSLDARPTYFATRLVSRDVCTDLVDIAAVNLYTKDPKTFKRQLDEWKSLHSKQPVVLAKFGTEVQPDNRNGYSDPLSQEAQARFYTQRLDAVKSLDYDGAIVWSFNDWKGDRPALTVNSGDPWMHTVGLVGPLREKRLAYDAVRSVFRSEKFVSLPIGNYSFSAPVIYVLSGLVVLIGSAYFYNANRRFRENVNRSLMNSYNFFADVRDQRIVSVLHSTLLGIIVSISGAIVLSSILYHFRESWLLDNMLSYVLISDSLKERVVYLIWSPLKSMSYLSALCFGVLVLTAIVVLSISPLFRTRIYPFHAYAITMWSTPPLLILVPIGMILYRIMESSVYVLPSLVVIAVLVFWVFLRLLKGLSIIFDAFPPKVYFMGILSVVGVLALLYFYLDYTQSASVYLSFMYNVMSSAQ